MIHDRRHPHIELRVISDAVGHNAVLHFKAAMFLRIERREGIRDMEGLLNPGAQSVRVTERSCSREREYQNSHGLKANKFGKRAAS